MVKRKCLKAKNVIWLELQNLDLDLLNLAALEKLDEVYDFSLLLRGRHLKVLLPLFVLKHGSHLQDNYSASLAS